MARHLRAFGLVRSTDFSRHDKGTYHENNALLERDWLSQRSLRQQRVFGREKVTVANEVLPAS